MGWLRSENNDLRQKGQYSFGGDAANLPVMDISDLRDTPGRIQFHYEEEYRVKFAV